jgi:hypothetical protein
MKLRLNSAFCSCFIVILLLTSASLAGTLTVTPTTLAFGNQAIGIASSGRIVTLKAGTTGAVSFTSISASGDFSQTNTCGTTLAAGASCIVTVIVTPTTPGARTGSLTITDDATGSPQSVALTGTGVVQAAVTPASLAFGSQAVATTTAAKAVILKNNLPTALSIFSISAAGDFSQTNNCGSSLAAGASCTVNVVFAPTTTGSRTGTLTITNSASNSPQTASLSGTGVVQAAATPGSLAFGSQAVATPSNSKAVTLTNNLGTALSVSSIAATGDFSQTNTCGTSLAAAGICTVNVTFTPTTTGARTGTLTITDSANNNPQTVSLTGTGLLQAAVAPATLAFGNQAAGTSSVAKTFTLANNLGRVLVITSIVASGDYSQTNTCGTSVAAGGTCTVSVVFTPTTTGSRTGTVVVTDSANNNPQSVALTGNGVVPVTVTPATLAFGNQGLSSTSAAKAITVSNKQPTAVTISSITTPGDYAQTNTCGTTLAANATCTVSMTFTPTAVGSRPGTLTVTDNATNSPQTVNLTGTGTALPVITSLTVMTGVVGTSVTVKGTGLGSAATGTLTFNGVLATTSAWTSTAITATVPAAATTGNVLVTVNGGQSNGAKFTVVPTLTSLSSTSGITGTTVTISGSGFGNTATGNSITFNGATATPSTWTSSLITVPVPATASTGSVVVTVNGVVGNALAFSVVPNVTGVSPTSGPTGTAVTITGSGFGATATGNSVTFNGIPATTGTWTTSSISTQVPSGATSGSVVVTIGGVQSNSFGFSVVPAITSLTPSSGSAGTLVTIAGSGFGSSATGNSVTFNGIVAATTTWTIGSVSATVPAGVQTGNVIITVNGVPSVPAAASLFTVLSSGLNTSRYQHSATILSYGKVLIAGGVNCAAPGTCTYLSSAELYDPAAGTSTNTGSMATARSAPAVALANGQVLIAGGFTCNTSGTCFSVGNAEVYDPASGTFSSTGSLIAARNGHTMTLLGNGQVLVSGGESCYSTTCSALNTAELYDPKTRIFVPTGNLFSARFSAGAVSLNNGLVLIAGGFDGTTYPARAELYDPAKGTFSSTGPVLNTPRFGATATLLNSGKVLLAGGSTCNLPECPSAVAELYDPVVNTFSFAPGSMSVPRLNHTATLLTNGQVLIAGGYGSCSASCTSDTSTELFNPATGTFAYGQILASARSGQSGTLLPNGNVALIGGINGGTTLTSIESYQPASLIPPGLVSIAIAPSAPSVLVGLTQQLVAAGTYSDGSMQILPSVAWNSSNPSIATISNSTGSAGIAIALATGTSTISASVGNVSSSTTLTVPTVTSMSLTPTNPSVAINATTQLKLTATGVYSDGTSRDITAYVSWASSNSVVASVMPSTFVSGVIAPVSIGTTNITATLGGMSASTMVTVSASTAVPPPVVTGVTPNSGTAGTQITIAGSGFGLNQGSGRIWLGSALATVVSWSDSQVVGIVAPNATNGVAKVQQNGVWSNSLPFGVNTAVITNVNPSNGLPGTQVTITGSGFGFTRGNGQVWLGTAAGMVSSWVDGQIVATVTPGSMTGVVQVVQNGVPSNSVPFAVNTPQITGLTPNSGGPGTTVTITGSGFGQVQGGGVVWIGSTNGQLITWSDTQIIAAVASNAVSGIVRVQQNGLWSNSLAFTVPPAGGGSAVTITPNIASMIVGETRVVQALDATGNPVLGLTWVSSDATIVSLSTDDPPIITAVAPGHATVTGGSGSVDVTVYAGSLAQGTIVWSVPGDGSGVIRIMPAVPSATGVADVFAVQGDGTVQAVTSSGAVAWTANVGGSPVIPDFQGGLVVSNGTTIQRLDGLTGQPYPAYSFSSAFSQQANVLVHTDSTIFAVDGGSIVGIDPSTGGTKFTIPLEQSIATYIGDGCLEFAPRTDRFPASVSNGIIAGDGYAYFPYSYNNYGFSNFCPGGNGQSISSHRDTHFRVMRVGSDGSSNEIAIQDWAGDTTIVIGNGSETTFSSGADGGGNAQGMISNADQGALLSWVEGITGNPQPVYHLTSILGGSAAGTATTADPLTPVLQAQDGSFIGTGAGMENFDASGNVRWSVPNFSPQIATAGGGVIAQSSDGLSTVAFDASGNATGQMPRLPVESWTGFAYQYGSLDQTTFFPTDVAASFWAFAQVNPSGSTTAVKQQWFPPLDHCVTTAGTPCIGPYEAIYNALGDLIARLPALSALADQNIFTPLGHDSKGNPATTKGFLSYLTTQRPRFYNGVVSNYCYDALTSGSKCHENALLNFLLDGQDVQTTFNDARQSALSGTPSNPLLVFIRPSVVLFDNLGQNRGNEALIFHEALHGYTGLNDRGTITVPRGILERLGGSFNDESCMIAVIIWNTVLSHSAGLNTATQSCP